MMQVTRRSALTRVLGALAVGSGAFTLGGCSADARLRLGAPTPYTPPLPGIDELYRLDLVDATFTLLSRVSAGPLADFPAIPVKAEAPLSTDVTRATRWLAAFPAMAEVALGAHLKALDTDVQTSAGDSTTRTTETSSTETSATRRDATQAGGTGQMKESSVAQQASATFAANGTTPADRNSPAQATTPRPLTMAEAVHALAELKTLHAEACLQTSGTFAGLSSAAGAWAAWAEAQLVTQASRVGANELPPVSTDAPTAANRPVPAEDPPVEASRSECVTLTARAQEDEWYSAYVLEVAAARHNKDTRAVFQRQSRAAAGRAKLYGALLERLGATPVAKEAGYPLPRPFDQPRMVEAQHDAALSALQYATQLTGLAPFAERSALTQVWLEAAHEVAQVSSTLDALPGLTPQKP